MTRITYLEDALHADTLGTLHYHLLEQLQQAEQHLCEQLRLPQSPAQFRALQQCANACVSAIAVIEALWGRYHLKPIVDARSF